MTTDKTCHDPVNALLPWLLNGTLSDEEDIRAREHVETCPICSDELDHLAAFALTMPERSAQPRPATTRPSRIPWVLAASLLLPALLGAYWALLGFPRPPTANPTTSPGIESVATLQTTVTVDLGAGPMRGVSALPSVTLGAGVGRVTTSFLLPEVADSNFSVELQDAGGRVLARGELVRSSADSLRCSHSMPADLFRSSGEYAIVLRETATAAAGRSYRFAFTVRLVRS